MRWSNLINGSTVGGEDAFSCSSNSSDSKLDDPPGFTPLADEIGDEGDDPDPVFGEHESPSVNMFEPPADKTDVGDWFS